jgi:hypothetical protein
MLPQALPERSGQVCQPINLVDNTSLNIFSAPVKYRHAAQVFARDGALKRNDVCSIDISL